MEAVARNNWGDLCDPQLGFVKEEPKKCAPKMRRPPKTYAVESPFKALFMGVAAATWSRATPRPRSERMAKPAALLPPENAAAIALLRSWREVDEQEKQEQRETWEFLQQALDEDRLSSRKFSP